LWSLTGPSSRLNPEPVGKSVFEEGGFYLERPP
jgi:hypothetical protein